MILIESEYDPSGGDEINLIKLNKDYGWPTTSFGDGGTVEYHDHKSQSFRRQFLLGVITLEFQKS
ncbi:PQQ-dependent sugar dehydrogenase [Alphaproteobacteria bacterium]|nr:PQQ-dependent sugar dehydrogenase [Alphaproteobacteria bacterium]